MYRYQAYTFDKKIVEGTVDAVTEAMAEESLLSAGYNRVLTLQKVHPAFSLPRLFPGLYAVKKSDIIDLFFQLATLLESRMPAVQALWLLSEQASKESLRSFVHQLGEELAAGAAFSQVLSPYPDLISSQYCRVIQASEKSGDLPRGLRLVAGYIEKEANIIHNIRRMMSYPAFLITMSCIVIVIIATVAVPSLMQLFLSLGVDLPLPTRLLVAVAGFIVNDKYYILAGLLVLVSAAMLLYRLPSARRWLDTLLLKLPLIRQVIIMRNIGRFCRSAGMLLESGLTLPRTLDTIIGTIDSPAMRRALEAIQEDLVKGRGLSRPMSASPFFPGLLIDMVGIGEKTGTLPSAFAAMADLYEKKLDQRVQKLLGMIEPATIILVGLVIAFIGIAIITPLYSIYQTVQ
jgi:type IV pilus assembly protein PilC